MRSGNGGATRRSLIDGAWASKGAEEGGSEEWWRRVGGRGGRVGVCGGRDGGSDPNEESAGGRDAPGTGGKATDHYGDVCKRRARDVYGGSTEKTLGTGTGWAGGDGTVPARVEGARGVGTVEGVRGLRRAHITRHLLAGGSALLFGCRFSISPRQSSKTFAVGAERGRVSRCGRREERGAGGEKREKEKMTHRR